MEAHDTELSLFGRSTDLFSQDVTQNAQQISEAVRSSSFLIIGGAGTIGQAVATEIFKRDPRKLHVVDLSENNIVELVRSLRSTVGYGTGEFKTFAIDCGSREFESLYLENGPYDYIFNLSALKHVRSESDPYTLMRMINVNVLNNLKLFELLDDSPSTRFFCVSTDKAANPVNMMGASKRIMELYSLRESLERTVCMARFANVAFSDGSLLQGFENRLLKRQPISSPNDVQRYFVTKRESGQLCLLTGIFAESRDIFFPKLSEEFQLTRFDDIARRYLNAHGYEAFECETEAEARGRVDELLNQKKWPCYFFESDTTGEKAYEEFFSANEKLDLNQFHAVGAVKNEYDRLNLEQLNTFAKEVEALTAGGKWRREDLIGLFEDLLPEFRHSETGKFLNERM